MLCTIFVIQLWLVGRWLLFLLDGDPVDAREPWVLHNLLGVSRAGTESSFRILVQKLSADVSSVVTQERKVQFRLAILDVSEQFFFIFAVEWGLAAKHFVDYATEGPPVRGLAVSLVQQDLRGQILGSAADTLGVVMAIDVLLGETEVGDLDVAIATHKDVFWFEIPVKDIL